MQTSTIHWAYIGSNLLAIVSFTGILIPLTRADYSTTVTRNSCGKYISLEAGTHGVHWKGNVLKMNCTIYIQNEPSYENTLCAEAVKYDVKDKHFILTFLSGTLYNENTKYFTAFEDKSSISYCAKKRETLALQFSTSSRKSESHVYLKITQTPFKSIESGGPTKERLSRIIYRLMGGIGSAIMVALLASVVMNRRRRARNGNFGRGGIIIRRAGEVNDEQRGEEMVALSRPSPGYYPEPCLQNGYRASSSMYPSQQPIRPPSYSEIQNDSTDAKQYPDAAPPSYEDIAENRRDCTKTQPKSSNA